MTIFSRIPNIPPLCQRTVFPSQPEPLPVLEITPSDSLGVLPRQAGQISEPKVQCCLHRRHFRATVQPGNTAESEPCVTPVTCIEFVQIAKMQFGRAFGCAEWKCGLYKLDTIGSSACLGRRNAGSAFECYLTSLYGKGLRQGERQFVSVRQCVVECQSQGASG